MVLAATKRYTVSEYLALEDQAEFKSEFIILSSWAICGCGYLNIIDRFLAFGNMFWCIKMVMIKSIMRFYAIY